MALSLNPNIKRLVCSRTGEEVDHDGFSRPIGLSPAGFPVVVEYDLDAIAAEHGDELFEDRQGMCSTGTCSRCGGYLKRTLPMSVPLQPHPIQG